MDLVLIINKIKALWAKVPQERLTQTIIVLLLTYIAFWFADFTWKLVPAKTENYVVNNTNSVANVSSSEQINIREIQQLNLFGEYNKKPVVKKEVEKIEAAPETKLQLTLTGLVASSDPTIAAAIIESKGKQETYGIDEKIEGTRTILKQVYTDRVIIETSGRNETLMLDGFDYTKTVPGSAGAITEQKRTATKVTSKSETKIDPEKQARIKERVAKARSDILANPAKLTDYIKVSPYRKDGVVKGYRLMPNKDPEFFAGVGLKPGDIAVQINGKDLTDMRQAQKALIELRKAEHVDLLVERAGELHSISMALNN
ncbi:type II secretion system protein GspC [Thalassomonas sp. M1454]|uniref:type II secretion system protein GspC n=1 Tax=Thalassomonas sp. M1454 TaxID=2594477 RepID=UPI00117C4B2C|nr:type II secretion system protein GspC [Thalassomonas sp. M1454]TRX57902.1 type II secretion system protein GspC [Thalassomonas sp. M1454]